MASHLGGLQGWFSVQNLCTSKRVMAERKKQELLSGFASTSVSLEQGCGWSLLGGLTVPRTGGGWLDGGEGAR